MLENGNAEEQNIDVLNYSKMYVKAFQWTP